MYFTKPETWFGGYYELAIEVGGRSGERLLSALKAVWSHPALEGCYLDRDKEPHEQRRVSVPPALAEPTHLQGLALLPNGQKVACGTCLIREEDGPDWLDFYMPMGTLGDVYEVGGYPFDMTSATHREWQTPVDEWLKGIGEWVFSSVPFSLGLIGFEVSGDAYAAQVSKEGVPAERYFGYLVPEGRKLKWYPPNVRLTP
ncbi:MAG TPA: hypothetical protein VLJ61_14955 [Pyrinomonadaceae bacterium]|nr:hypothetical protein [Pyrinomonadaceae bacterium]